MESAQAPWRARLWRAAVAPALIVVFCLGLLRGNPAIFWNDDYQISILPVLTDVARSWHEGHWPLLSPYSWACGNLAGEYQYGTFSLFLNLLIVVVWKFPLAFAAQAAALSITHLAVLGSGAYLLARGRKLGTALSVLVALVAALNGWIIGWGASDWFGALAADAWLPWCWWAFETAMRPAAGAESRRERARFLLPVPFVYLVLSAGFPYTVVRLGLVTAWLGIAALAQRRGRALWPLVTGWLLGLGLSAPAWLSLLENMHGSNRSQGAGVGNFAWTVPLHALPGFILPDWTTRWNDFADIPATHAALELTGGFIPIVGLIAASIILRQRVWRALRWDLGLLAVVAVLCVLPSPGVFRWSFRWLPLLHLILALVGAQSFQALWAERRRDNLASPGFHAFVLAIIAYAAMIFAHTANHDAITHALPGEICGVAFAWWLFDRLFAARSTWRRWLVPLAALASLWVSYQHMYTNPGLPIYGFGPGLTKIAPLSPDRLYLSLYREPHLFYWARQTPPDFGTVVRPGSTEMFAGVHTINGYSPIMPAGAGQLLDMETHGSIPPPIGHNLLADEGGPGGLLARMGVEGLLIGHDYPPGNLRPPAEYWEEVYDSPEGTVYHRRGPRLGEVGAWANLPAPRQNLAEPKSTSAAPDAVPLAASEVSLQVISDSRMGLSADVRVSNQLPSPATLLFHRPYYPGYRAELDGHFLAVDYYGAKLLPEVQLPPGSHGRLVLSYRPRAILLGVALAALSAVVFLLLMWWQPRALKIRAD